MCFDCFGWVKSGCKMGMKKGVKRGCKMYLKWGCKFPGNRKNCKCPVYWTELVCVCVRMCVMRMCVRFLCTQSGECVRICGFDFYL